jgi:hypothetical protein
VQVELFQQVGLDARRDPITEQRAMRNDDCSTPSPIAVTAGAAGARVTTTEVRNADRSLQARSVGTVSEDARETVIERDVNGDGKVDVKTRDTTTIAGDVAQPA